MIKKLIKIILYPIVFVGVLMALSALYVFWFYGTSALSQKDCGVIFGAAVWKDDIPSTVLHDRTMSTANLYKAGKIDCIIMSGGASTYGSHEVDVMAKVLTEANVPEEVLEYDYDGKNTIETLKDLDQDRSYTLISNDFHLGRIDLLAKREDIEDYDLHAATYLEGRYPREAYFVFREVIANIYYGLWLDLAINKPKI